LVDARRGEIWWASLPEPSGSEPGYRRPVVILQADSFNRSRIRTVIGVGLTTNLRQAEAPGNVLLPSHQTNLPADSVANVSQVITIDKGDLLEWIGPLPAQFLRRIEDGVRLILDL
jgi:mRNA interferase MazF